MDANSRIIVNTIAQYLRSVINMALALFTTRIVINGLGMSDYGIYTLVGGIVLMMGFVSHALVLTTQRYVSYYHGKGDKEQVVHIFKNSLALHCGLSAVLFLALCMLQILLIDNLVIEPDRVETAHFVYLTSSLVLVFTILLAPFKSLFIARENILFISVVEVAEAVMKLALAFVLMSVDVDKLWFYALMMLSVHVVNFLAFAVYALWKYEECQLSIGRKDLDKEVARQLMGFAGWNIYCVGAGIIRNQGIAVVLNRMMGTAINAAYGIGFQIYGAVGFVASSVLNAMNPQIMKREGAGDRTGMLHLAAMESKYSTLLMSIVMVPLSFEMTGILQFWLGKNPPYAAMFTVFILVAFVADQLTIGLNAAQQAVGNLKSYSLLFYTPKCLVPVAGVVSLYLGFGIESLMWIYLAVETVTSLLRTVFFKYTQQMSVRWYFNTAFWPVLPVLVLTFVACLGCVTLIGAHDYRFVLTLAVSGLTGLASAWYFSLSESEKRFVISLIHKKR